MSLVPGTQLGPYEILAPLGAGGMGEVYRARDTRLDRTVAIKVLSSVLTANADVKARFEREARAISQLQHPHICTLHDIGRAEIAGGSPASTQEIDYLVMEYLEGETLADRLHKGAVPVEQVMKIGVEIADALDKAHRAGIVHRDLKPGNIMLTKSGAKLLDFGLAKPFGAMAAASGSAPLLSAAATLGHASPQVSPLTMQGTIVGTVQYMSPEQIEGKEADARSDIFAFGAVLYEMATGKRAFAGKSQLTVASAILEKDPEPVSVAQPKAPAALEHIISSCLAKDPGQRWQCAADVARELHWIATTPATPPAKAGEKAPAARGVARVAAIGVLVGLVLGAGAVLTWRRSEPRQPLTLSLLSPEGASFNFAGLYGAPAISPDGTKIAFIATVPGGDRSLWIRPLAQATAQRAANTDGASFPFWSPDGRFVGFFAQDKLKTLDVAAGATFDVCAAPEGRGGTWNERGDIVFGKRANGLFRVAASGGAATPLTKLDIIERGGSSSHRFPTFLPDGETLIFVVQTGQTFGQVATTSLHDPTLRLLPNVVSNVAYRDGLLYHVRNGSLMAQRFDAKRLVFTGDPAPLASPVQYDAQFNYAAFSVAGNGTIVYEGGLASRSRRWSGSIARGRRSR